MKDRELLELAAKAAGIECEWDDGGSEFRHVVPFRNYINYEPWNPLRDGEDALRLAVMLKFSVTVFEDAIGVGFKYENVGRYLEFDIEGDVFLATCRAITSAAAQLQLEKENK